MNNSQTQVECSNFPNLICDFMRKHHEGTSIWSALQYYECLHFKDTISVSMMNRCCFFKQEKKCTNTLPYLYVLCHYWPQWWNQGRTMTWYEVIQHTTDQKSLISVLMNGMVNFSTTLHPICWFNKEIQLESIF